MPARGLEILDHSVQQTHEWINELDELLGWTDPRRTFRLLRVCLQVVRDCAPIGEAADFAAQLPTFLRGLFYEHWRPGAPAVRYNVESFFDRVDEAFRGDPIEDVGGAVETVLAFLSHKISNGEARQLRQTMPHAIRALWPQ
jgi:uncharacterized protein (DUF2267 family)